MSSIEQKSSVKGSLLCLTGCLVVILASCTGVSERPTDVDESPQLFEIPRHWEVVDERRGEVLYQANLRNNQGSGRMLLGRLKLKSKPEEPEAFLYKLHNDLVDRIRGEADVAPFSEDRLAWANGTVGYRTKMRGELGRDVVMIEGITLSDNENAYFHYGLFPEESYQSERFAFSTVLKSLAPIRGEEQLRDRGFDVIARAEPTSSEIGSDGAASPEDYHSPQTHLGVAAWGSSREEIQTQAGLPLRKGPNALGYSCQFAGTEDCLVVYMFEFDRLTHGGILFQNKFESPGDYVSRYLRMTKRLSEAFGRPMQSAAIWVNPEFRNEGSRWGEALENEDVIFGTVWNLGPTKLVHSLRSVEGEIQHRVVYSNDELRQKLQAQSADVGPE